MFKFKVGDKVVRLDGTPTELFRKIIGSKKYYIVTYVSDCGRWIQVDGVHHLSDAAPWGTVNFELYKEPEDELPPVPASVTYMNSKRYSGNDQRLVLDKDNGCGEGLMYIGVIPRKGSTRAQEEIGINIDPDSALQLAHDLRRMAMSVRREGRDG
ncbi:hypothetical protein HOS00_gp12 [Klebsiella phage AltoGao]|uniref:Uncharacterized protein n=1 Tax=Klebsiella phage AltoGao TaxID=2026943 RepID=A0A248SL26_9CAUD|nr:hypothetical protein HOS00_gp12 [Klebsiella phage AltoGao]ASV44905.1 hypothetical protein AltoGao_12 [Klebsiella phage AltoGao]